MDYKQNISVMIKGLLLLLLLSACSDEINTGAKLEPDSLDIIGFNKIIIYYDTSVAFSFGASGGDGVHRYRYIQNPENPDDRGEDFIFNPVELTIKKIEGPKPSFILSGIHRTEEGLGLENLPQGVFLYQIEITDGKNVKVESFELELKVNKLKFEKKAQTVTEGLVDNRKADTFRNSKQLGNTTICDDVVNNSYEKKTLANGVTVYPFVVIVALETPLPLLESVEYFYRFTSRYDDEFPERHKVNNGFARANVDFLDESRSVVFEAGKLNCVIYLNVLDDAIYEGTESVWLDFYDAKGALTDLSVHRMELFIQDNEPLPLYESKNVLRNEGEKIISTISLLRAHTHPIAINFSADMSKTTATADDYLLTPESGVLTIEPGETEASFTVSLLNNDDDASVADDDVIYIVTDIDNLLDVEPLTITINEWPRVSENEIVATESLDQSLKQKALALNVNALGLTSILLESMSDLNEEQAIVLAKNRDGSEHKLSRSSGTLVLGKQGIRVKPVAIGSYVSIVDTRARSYLTVVANVDGLYSNIHRGLGDFIVAVYKLDIDENSGDFGLYTLESVEQYGSEGNDIANGASFDRQGNVFVFGQTNGLKFDGNSGTEENNGGVNGKRLDGFVYKIEVTTNTSLWDSPRFIGTDENDGVVALDVGRSEFILLAEKENFDTNAFLRKLSATNGTDIKNIKAINLFTIDLATSVAFDRNDSSFFALLDSSYSLFDGSPTQSFTRDINIVKYAAGGTQVSIKNISTNQDDFSVVIENITNTDVTVIGGYTEGELAGNQKKGDASTTDAFISTFIPNDANSTTLLQFGTEGNDKVIAVASVSENKFLVLWSEDHTDVNGLLTYRVSAFSSEGVMLSKEP